MMVLLAGTILGGIQGAAAVGLYIIGGILGLPVFAGGRSGIAALASPSGGFIVGYFAGSLVAGLFLGRPSVGEGSGQKRIRAALASVICFALIYVFGISHMMRNLGLSLPAAIAAGFLPYAPGDAVKLVIAIPLAIKLRPVVARYISPEEGADGASGTDGSAGNA
jgi:biotin transport system substrate-specific component